MVKYIKQKDALEVWDKTASTYVKAILDLPTIEVSEDCISREWVKGICEAMLDEEMLGHMLGYIEDAPSVIPQVPSEDAISREEVYRAIITCGEVDNDLNHLYEVIENFPSVVPQPKEGGWIETYEGTMCGNCHKFPYDDGEYHIANWHSDFCPNCGARMKGVEE